MQLTPDQDQLVRKYYSKVITAKHLQHLPGWCSLEKADHLMQLVQEYQPATIVEIGVYGGRSLLPMVLAAPETSTIHGIDPWSRPESLQGMDEAEHVRFWGSVDHEAIYEGFVAACLEYLPQHERKRLNIYREPASTALQHFADGSIDFLHQDGNHHTVLDEVIAWYPKLKKGAVWVFDDINWPSVQPAVDLLNRRCRLIDNRQTYAVYRKED